MKNFNEIKGPSLVLVYGPTAQGKTQVFNMLTQGVDEDCKAEFPIRDNAGTFNRMSRKITVEKKPVFILTDIRGLNSSEISDLFVFCKTIGVNTYSVKVERNV